MYKRPSIEPDVAEIYTEKTEKASDSGGTVIWPGLFLNANFTSRRWVPLIMVVLCLSLLILSSMSQKGGLAVGWLVFILIFAMLLIGANQTHHYIERHQNTRYRPLLIGFFVLEVILLEAAYLVSDFRFVFFLYIFLPIQAFPYFGKKAAFWISGSVWLVFTIHLVLFTNDILNYLLLLLTWSLNLLLFYTRFEAMTSEKKERQRREQLLQELEISHRQLQRYATQVEELATVEERNRLAREIHDSLGHYLTGINIQIEKAMLEYKNGVTDTYQTMGEAKRLAAEALQDVRRSVGALRSSEGGRFSLIEALQKLVDSARRNSAALQLELYTEGTEQGFSQQVLHTLYRVVQEGLTNIQKHAGASKAVVMLELSQETARVTVFDNGQGFDPTRLAQFKAGRLGGYGLQGMRERLEMLGGQLSIETTPGSGTSLTAIVAKTPFGKLAKDLSPGNSRERELLDRKTV